MVRSRVIDIYVALAARVLECVLCKLGFGLASLLVQPILEGDRR